MKKSIKSDINGGTVSFELSTNVLPIVSVNLYGLLDDLIWHIDQYVNTEWYDSDANPDYEYADFNNVSYNDGMDRAIMNIATPIIEDAIREILPSANITPTEVYHPRYYNFEKDELYFTLTCSASEYNALFERTVNDPAFENFLKSNYRSYDGFISFMADDLDEFYKQEDWRQAAQVIAFNIDDSQFDNYQRDYYEAFSEYFEEHYDELLDGIEYRDTYEG